MLNFDKYIKYSKSVLLNEQLRYSYITEELSKKMLDLKKYLTTHYTQKDNELKSIDKNLTGKKVGEKEYSSIHTIFDLVKGYYRDKKIDYNLPGYYFYEYDSTVEDVYLIHFSSAAQIIYDSQEFKFGPSEPENIAKAHLAPKDRDIKVPHGYNFAFSVKDVIKYGLGYLMKFKFLKLSSDGNANLFSLGKYLTIKNKSMYGQNAIIFFVPAAIRIYAPMDKQYQMIFYSTEAKNINLIVNEDGLWKIKDKTQTEVIFEDKNLSNVIKNYINGYEKNKLKLK